ncbi:hypothetical protein [Xenorhabdus lircayensis]|uniref:Integral membrane protein n=1 Tax=Xenorhabdus lircayensis TaxID=2763499 RepID=A0ABS0U3G7_9GAMM|nr:hypothetical protein [Xenorhabdus lircayensis]MBI6548414.1 hypothetical protein [Xenorhabdus lircayensis]
MEDFLFFVAILFFLLFIVGLVKLNAVLMPSRKIAALVYLVIFVASIIAGAELFSSKQSMSQQSKNSNSIGKQSSHAATLPIEDFELAVKETLVKRAIIYGV